MAQDLKELRIIPGVNTEMTPALAQASIIASNMIRWKSGLFEQIGGWQSVLQYGGGTPGDIARFLWGWQDFNQNDHLAIGTGNAMLVATANTPLTIPPRFSLAPVPITPQTATTNTPPNFSTTSGSNVVTIIDPNFVGPSLNDSIYIATPVSVGGIILYGFYQITLITGADQYQIQAAQPATSTVTNGGVVPTFSTTVNSSAVQVVLPNHGLEVGESFSVQGPPVVVDGLTISGNYLVSPPPSAPTFTPNQFTITATTLATSTAGPVSENNGNVLTTYYVTQGPTQAYVGWGELSWGFPVNAIQSLGTVVPGSGYTPATGTQVYPNVALTGGSGTGARGDITVTNGSVAQVLLDSSGQGYTAGDVLTAPASAIGGTGSGFSVPVGVVNAGGGWGTGVAPSQGSGMPLSNVTDWTGFNWGDILVFCPAGGAVYEWEPQTGNQNGAIIPQAPIACDGIFLAQPQQILVCWGVTTGQTGTGTAANIGVKNPLRLVWSDAGNFNVFTPAPNNFAGGFDLTSGSRIVSCVQGANMFGVWTDIGVWSGTYVGQPLVFSIIEVMKGCGLIGRKAVGVLGTTFYWMSQNQFFQMSAGGVPTPMPCPIWDRIFQSYNRNATAVDHIRFYSNAAFNEIGWFFPAGTNTENNFLVKYDVVQNAWDYTPIARSAWIDQSILGPPIGSANGLQGEAIGLIMQHEIGTLANGTPLNCFVMTGDFVLGTGDQFQFLDYLIPDFRYGLFNGTQNAQASITFYMGEFPSDAQGSLVGAAYPPVPNIIGGPFTVNSLQPYIEPRIRGRTVAMFINWSSAANTFLRSGLCRYRSTPDGRNP